jgi:hypothetical protein
MVDRITVKGKPVYESGLEKHYTPQQVAEEWGISIRTIKRLAEGDPDVLRICLPRQLGSSEGQRVTLRIPASVVRRWHDYWSLPVKPSVVKASKPSVVKPVEPPKVVKTLVKKRRPKPSDAAPPASKEPESADAQSSDEQ